MRQLRQGELTNGVDPNDYPPYDIGGIYPWSVLRADSGDWQTRKRHWLHLGVDDLAGRTDIQIFPHGKSGRHHKISAGKSRFDPVLAELLYTWYSPPGGLVADPFAGGVTRGLIAAHLGRHYIGVDLSPIQVESNRGIASGWDTAGTAAWHAGDASHGLPIPDGSADHLIACPPYHNIERYSDDPRDLSAMTWEQHLDALQRIAGHAWTALRDDRFANWIVGDLRGPSGHLRMLPEHTVRILVEAGFQPVNHQILTTPIGTMYRMLRRWWTNTRSAGRIHQHVYTVVKGDRRKAVEAINAR